MKLKKARAGFSMVTAVFVIVLMATVAAFIMSTSGKMVKETTDLYQREQAMLLANSYEEYAVMAVTANEHNTANCLDEITSTYGIYTIDVNISYIGNDENLGGGSTTGCDRILSSTVTTPKSPLNIIVDTFVGYDEIDSAAATPPRIMYHKRRLLKI